VTDTLRSPENIQLHHEAYEEALAEENGYIKTEDDKTQPFVRQNEKVGRNQPCPCGSGKKYKQCHGKIK